MAGIRTARLVAAAASVPLAFALMGGVASADNGGFANDDSNAIANTQVAAGPGTNTPQANNANVEGDHSPVLQHNETTNVYVMRVGD